MRCDDVNAASTLCGRRRGGEPHVTADPLLPIGLIRNFRDAKHPRTESGIVIRQHLKLMKSEAV